jgi:hypothetical protein
MESALRAVGITPIIEPFQADEQLGFTPGVCVMFVGSKVQSRG